MSNEEYFKIDEINRRDVASRVDTNFFVSAGAGSGKTTTLVNRMVNMVKSGIPVDKICAITFTKAAANEFYERFQKKLSESDDDNCRRALKDIDLCFMGTIDAFCQRLLSEHPIEAGLPASFEHIDDKDLVSLVYRKLSQIKSDKSSDYWEVRELFRDINQLDDYLAGGITKYWGMRNSRLVYEDIESRDTVRRARDEAEELLSFIMSNKDKKFSGSRSGSSNIAWVRFLKNIDVLKAEWTEENLSDVIKALDDKVVSALRFDKTIDALQRDRLLVKNGSYGYKLPPYSALDRAREALENLRHQKLLMFIESFVSSFSIELKNEGKITYFDALYYLRDMLLRDIKENDSRLIRHVQGIHKYYLVDEFQDTNPLQSEVLFYLTAKESKENWAGCVPDKGTLFIVGDPKQSIYRFRSADITSFNRVKNLFRGEVGEVRELIRNFRSSDSLCSYFNTSFERILNENEENKGSFDLKIPVEGTFDGKSVLRYVVDSPKDEDGGMVSEIISSLVSSPDFLIPTKDGKRRAEYRDFMVITPNKKELVIYMAAFREASIPYVVEGAVMFGESFALRLVYYFFKYFLSPYDKGARFGLENLSGINLDDEEIKTLVDSYMKYSPSALFAKIMSLNEFEDKAITENYEYVYYALELLRAKEASGDIVSIKDTIDYLESLILEDSDDERCLQLQRDSNAVKLANLHKVKGLEAEVVILAYPKAKAVSKDKEKLPDERIVYDECGSRCYLFTVKPPKKKGSYTSSGLECHLWDNSERREEKESLLAEKARQLYVAATRARNLLIVSEESDSDKNMRTAWFKLQHDVPSIIELPQREEEFAEIKLEPERVGYEKLILSDKLSLPTYKVERPSDEKKSIRRTDDDEVLDSPVDNTDATLKGTLVHRLMEIIVMRKGDAVDDKTIDFILSEYLDDEDVARKAKLQGMLCSVRDKLFSGGFKQTNGASDDIIRTIRDSDEAYSEVPFCYEEGDTIVNGVIDLVYRKGDKWHIIDYKTNRDDKNLNLIYEGQLNTYKKAFEKINDGKMVEDALIYHVDIKKLLD